MSFRLALVMVPMLVTVSGCYLAHERRADAAVPPNDAAMTPDAGADAGPDVGIDAPIPPECVMSGGCAGDGPTIVLAHADPAFDGPGCVDIDVAGSDAIDCDGPITPIRIVRCEGRTTLYDAAIMTVAADAEQCGVAVFYDEETCRCESWHAPVPPPLTTSISDGMGLRTRGFPVLEIGLLGRGVGYRLRACAIE